MAKATKKAPKKSAPKKSTKPVPRAAKVQAPVALLDPPTTHTIDGTTVTRHHPEGDSVQIFDTEAAAHEYAASIPPHAK